MNMKASLQIFTFLLVAVVVFAFLVKAKVDRAHSRVDRFCTSVAVGSPLAGLKEKAEAAGFDRVWEFHPSVDKTEIRVMSTGFVFLRFFCGIEAYQDKVSHTRSFLTD